MEPLIQPRPHLPLRNLGHTVSDTRSRTLGLGPTISDALSRTETDALVLSGAGRAATRSQLRKHNIMVRAEIRLRLDMGSRSMFSFNAFAFMSWDAQTPHACLQGSTRLTACNDIFMHSLCLCHGIHRRRMHASRRAAHDLLPATTYFARV